MKLSIMMSAYNAERTIEDSLHSLLRQRDAAEMTIVVVNDGSTDQTGAILDRMAAEYGELRVVHSVNQGVTKARNVALDHVPEDAELLSFLDADDLSPDGRFAHDLRYFEDDPALEFLYSKTCLFRVADRDLLKPLEGSDTLVLYGIQLAAGIFRASLIKRIGRFDEEFIQAEDTDYLLRLMELWPNYRRSDGVGVYYRQHPGTLTEDKKVVLREFSRALMKSVKRRKKLGPDFTMPQDIFDLKAFQTNPGWIHS